MAGKSVDMSKIKQVLQLSQNKVSNRQIARDLDINKETVENYVRFFRSDTLPLKELLKMEDPELDSRFRAGNPAYTDARHQTFLDELPRFRESLRKKHVTISLGGIYKGASRRLSQVSVLPSFKTTSCCFQAHYLTYRYIRSGRKTLCRFCR